MSFLDSIKSVLSKYATFNGRARRSEFWWYYLAYVIVVGVLYGVLVGPGYAQYMADISTWAAAGDATAAQPVPPASMMTGYVVMSVIGLALFLPTLAVQARRLHDTGKSALFLLLHLGCGIGSIVLLFLLIPEGTRGPNQFGEDPKALAA